MSRTITGIALIGIGIAVMVLGLFSSLIFFVYGVVILAVGVLIFFNKDEDKIEKRKDMKGGRKKKK